MNLIKVYDKTCDICSMLAGIDEQVAEDYSLFFRKITLSEAAENPSTHRDHLIEKYVDAKSGMIDIPIYILTNEQGNVQASGVVKTVDELKNLIEAYRKWESYQK